jgi:AcrR family transcriptional regulator
MPSRDDLIEATAYLLRRQGYAATGLDEITARGGAPGGLRYFHARGGKEQLAVAAMDRAGQQLRVAIEAIVASSEDVARALARLIDVMAAGLERLVARCARRAARAGSKLAPLAAGPSCWPRSMGAPILARARAGTAPS